MSRCERERRCEEHVYDIPSEGCLTPWMPGVTGTLVLAFNFPTAELLIEPPSIVAVTHLDVRKPFGND